MRATTQCFLHDFCVIEQLQIHAERREPASKGGRRARAHRAQRLRRSDLFGFLALDQ